MISVENEDGITHVKARVTDFTNSMGYCEYKIPFYAKNVYVATEQMNKGEEYHEEAETLERIFAIPIPLKAKDLKNKKKDLNFFRENIHSTYTLELNLLQGKAMLTLFGRADKIVRKNSTLTITDDKRTSSPFMHIKRTEPFPDQLLQVLAYLHSKFYFGKKFGGWIEIPHEAKAYRVNIIDGNTGKIYKTYENVVTQNHKSLLEQYAATFVLKCMELQELKHHNNKNKCQPCGYFKANLCQFAIK